MERMLVIVFNGEKKAYEGESALNELAEEGSITLFSHAVVAKDAAGRVTVKESQDLGPIGTLSGTAVGGLVGLLGGPVGAAVGAASGLTLGAFYDIARIGEEFTGEVTKSLAPGTYAVIAEVEEEWTTPVDVRMEALGGTVLRRSLSEVREGIHEEEIASMKADLAQLKAEHAQAKAERKAKLQARIDDLKARLDAQQKKNDERLGAFRARQKAKAELLKKNTAAAGAALKQLARTPV